MDGADSRQAMKRSSLWSGSPRKRAGGLDAAQHSTAQRRTYCRAGFRLLAVLGVHEKTKAAQQKEAWS